MTPEPTSHPFYTRPALSRIRAIINEVQACELTSFPGHIVLLVEPPQPCRLINERQVDAYLRQSPSQCYLVPSNLWLAHRLSLSITPGTPIKRATASSGDWARMSYFSRFKAVCDTPPISASLSQYSYGDHTVLAGLLGRGDEGLVQVLTAGLKPQEVNPAAEAWFERQKAKPVWLWKPTPSAQHSRQPPTLYVPATPDDGGLRAQRRTEVISLSGITIPPMTSLGIRKATSDLLTPQEVSVCLRAIGEAVASCRGILRLSIQALATETGVAEEQLAQVEQGGLDAGSALRITAVLRGFFRQYNGNAALAEGQQSELAHHIQNIVAHYESVRASVSSKGTMTGIVP